MNSARCARGLHTQVQWHMHTYARVVRLVGLSGRQCCLSDAAISVHCRKEVCIVVAGASLHCRAMPPYPPPCCRFQTAFLYTNRDDRLWRLNACQACPRACHLAVNFSDNWDI